LFWRRGNYRSAGGYVEVRQHSRRKVVRQSFFVRRA
jgi:hypothetical protein